MGPFSEAYLAYLLPLRNLHVLWKATDFLSTSFFLWYCNLLVLNRDPSDQLVFD